MEGSNIVVPIFRTVKGWHTCRLDATNQCQFLGFRMFGQVPVCMKGEQHDLNYYATDPLSYIEPTCNLAEKCKGGRL